MQKARNLLHTSQPPNDCAGYMQW